MKVTDPRCHGGSFPTGFAYDPDYGDPNPAPPPRARSRWPFIVGAACWFIALALVLALIARQLP